MTITEGGQQLILDRMAFISITPSGAGTVEFATIPQGDTIPKIDTVSTLSSYRKATFNDKSSQIIQFAFSNKAKTSEKMTPTEDLFLSPSTAYDIVVYEAGKEPRVLHGFTTKAATIMNLEFVTSITSPSGGRYKLELSSTNFHTDDEGNLSVPIAMPISFSPMREGENWNSITISVRNKDGSLLNGLVSHSFSNIVSASRIGNYMSVFTKNSNGIDTVYMLSYLLPEKSAVSAYKIEYVDKNLVNIYQIEFSIP